MRKLFWNAFIPVLYFAFRRGWVKITVVMLCLTGSVYAQPLGTLPYRSTIDTGTYFVGTENSGGMFHTYRWRMPAAVDSALYLTRYRASILFDTTSLSNRINLKGSGTVTNIVAGAGLSGGTITSTGTISMPSVISAASWGNSTTIPVFNTDVQGRVTGVTGTAIAFPATDSSTFTTKYYDSVKYVPRALTLTAWGSAYSLFANRTISPPSLDVVVTASGSTSHTASFDAGLNIGNGSFESKFTTLATANRAVVLKDGAGTIAFTNDSAILGSKYGQDTASGNVRAYVQSNYALTTALPVLRNKLLSGTGIATTFTFTAPSSGTYVQCQSLNAVATVQSCSILGTTVTVNMTAAPASGINNISLSYWYQ